MYSALPPPWTGELRNGTHDGADTAIMQSVKPKLPNGVPRAAENPSPLLPAPSLPKAVEGAADSAVTEPYIPTTGNQVNGVGSSAEKRSGGQLQVMCGPLLNYQGMTEERTQTVWHGSVLLVVKPGSHVPHLELVSRGAVAQTDTQPAGVFSSTERATSVEGLELYQDSLKAFWRFSLRVPLGVAETKWEYSIQDMHFLSDVSNRPSRTFVVPAVSQSMRLMFHSCNGFSVGTDEDYWSGEADSVPQRLNCDNADAYGRPGAVEQRSRITCTTALPLYDWRGGPNLQRRRSCE